MSGLPRLLDLFCGAGGAAMGYHRAGFEVVGVDNKPQPRYPFEFHEADALTWGDFEGFAAIHASPPCQAYSITRNIHPGREYPDLIEPVRERLEAWGGVYVIENVPGAPLREPVQLCGSAFGLNVRRHRLFESNAPLFVPPCQHGWQVPRFDTQRSRRKSLARVVSVVGHGTEFVDTHYLSPVVQVYGSTGGKGVGLDVWKEAMGIDWMIRSELAEAIPPVYTEVIGYQLLTAPSRLATEGRALPYMGRRRWGQEMTGSR